MHIPCHHPPLSPPPWSSARSATGMRTKQRGSYLMLDSAPGCLATLPELRIRHRVGPFKWLWAHELFVEDLGQFR